LSELSREDTGPILALLIESLHDPVNGFADRAFRIRDKLGAGQLEFVHPKPVGGTEVVGPKCAE
jgi:hypothetical protein